MHSFDMKTTLKTITDRATGSVKIKWTVLQASQLNTADPGNCFLVEMLVFTAESKADFLITPGKGWRKGIGSGEEGQRIFCSVGARIRPLW